MELARKTGSCIPRSQTNAHLRLTLHHYDPDKELLLACNASPFEIGAILSHQMEDGTKRPIAFASRSLSKEEKNYAHLDKEALVIMFGVRKFHQYLYDRTFTIFSDHKPLKHIFNENRGIPAMASSRVQRWALALGAYGPVKLTYFGDIYHVLHMVNV